MWILPRPVGRRGHLGALVHVRQHGHPRLAPHAHRRIDTRGTKGEVRERVEDALADVLAPRFAGPLYGPVER